MSDINFLRSENDRLRIRSESKDTGDIGKRLKKREMECQALWDTLNEIKDFFDVNMILKILAKRALDSKGMRKM